MSEIAVNNQTDAVASTQENETAQNGCCTPSAAAGSATATRAQRTVRPAADVSATAQALLIEVEMPGIPPQNVEVRTEDRMLIITGANESVEEGTTEASEGASPAKGYHREWARRRYERRFRVGEDYDLSKTAAAYKHGVLSLRIEKAEQLKPRKIEIQVA